MIKLFPAATSNQAFLLCVQKVWINWAVEESTHHEVDSEDSEDKVNHSEHNKYVEDVAYRVK